MNNDQKTRPEKFWDRMFELYGMKWANSYGTEPSELWIKTIDALPNHKIKHAVSAFLNAGGSFVPTLPEFIEATKNAPRPIDPNAARLEHKVEQLTPEQQRENKRLFAEVAKLATQGKFKGWSEADINEYINNMRGEI